MQNLNFIMKFNRISSKLISITRLKIPIEIFNIIKVLFIPETTKNIKFIHYWTHLLGTDINSFVETLRIISGRNRALPMELDQAI